MAASLQPTFPPETTHIGSSKCEASLSPNIPWFEVPVVIKKILAHLRGKGLYLARMSHQAGSVLRLLP